MSETGGSAEVPTEDIAGNDVTDASDVPGYASILKHLVVDSKRLGSVLEEAEIRRAAALSRLTDDVRLKGANDLLGQLDHIATAFATEPRLRKLTFLIRRAIADFETALEATLSSYTAVAFDAMRDVLEIDYLLRDFAVDQQLIDEWLNADEKTLLNKFSPGSVRKRLQAAGVARFGEKAQSIDYKGTVKCSTPLRLGHLSCLIKVEPHLIYSVEIWVSGRSLNMLAACGLLSFSSQVKSRQNLRRTS
jgi:hypothetical protein